MPSSRQKSPDRAPSDGDPTDGASGDAIDAIDRVIRGYLGNPFDAPADVRNAADDALASLRVSAAIGRLLEGGDRERAKRLLLAAGHAHAQQSPDRPVPSRLVPRSIAARLPRPLTAYKRIIAAAGRCFHALRAIRGSSDGMQRARRDTWAACFGETLHHALELERVIRDHDVMILGETGTGKESFARAILAGTPGDHTGAPAPSEAINAAALPETLVESELFGHVKGAFTGAHDTRTGRLRSADGGCFFLDEVGDLPSTTQVKLLRVIELGEVYPLGSDASYTVDLRYVAATHKDLEGMVEDGSFRRDLLERLAGNVIRIPPLRERPDDIVEIGRAFVGSYLGDGADATAGAVRAVSETIDAWLGSPEARGYPWPGNVRELQNALRNLLLGLPAGLDGKHGRPPRRLSDRAPDGGDEAGVPPAITAATASLDAVTDWYIEHVVAAAGNNLSQAAKILDVDRSTVRRRLRASPASGSGTDAGR